MTENQSGKEIMADNTNSRRTIAGTAEGEIVEKKSRFIACLKHVETEAEAEAFLNEQKKKYYDARHHCSAFILGNAPEIKRSSDDGEPGGSAGRPMLSVLEGEELHDTIAVVTRYFGGTLLGVGGLIRAYQGAVKAALENASYLEKKEGLKLMVAASYNDDGRLQYQWRQQEQIVLDTVYSDVVTTTLLIAPNSLERVKKEIADITGGRAAVEEGPLIIYGWAGGRVVSEESKAQ